MPTAIDTPDLVAPLFTARDLVIRSFDEGGNANRVFRPGKPVQVNINWAVQGAVSPYLGGAFTLRVFAESSGPGPERLFEERVIPVEADGHYDVTIELNPRPPAPGPAVAGVYTLTVVLNYSNFGVVLPIVGFGREASAFMVSAV